MAVETLSVPLARRLALARAGLFPHPGAPATAPDAGTVVGTRQAQPAQQPAHPPHPPWDDAARLGARERRRRDQALAEIRRFGYLQIDSVSVAGARSHAIVLAARSAELPAALGEELLRPGEPLYEYWGHEASWLPVELYPLFAFRRREFVEHPWWGANIRNGRRHRAEILARLAAEGPLHAKAFEAAERRPSGGFWNLPDEKKALSALWSAGDIVVRERRGFQRIYDLPERALPPAVLAQPDTPEVPAIRALLLLALAGAGWATRSTLAGTWRLRNRRQAIDQALAELVAEGLIVPCDLVPDPTEARVPTDSTAPTASAAASRPADPSAAVQATNGRGRTPTRVRGFVRPGDLELAAELATRAVPAGHRGVLLSPFDPLLWDRERVAQLFAFDATLEIFKPARERRWGYYCLPVLAGERLVSRVDLKADRRRGTLTVLARHDEPAPRRQRTLVDRAVASALSRYAAQVELTLAPG